MNLISAEQMREWIATADGDRKMLCTLIASAKKYGSEAVDEDPLVRVAEVWQITWKDFCDIVTSLPPTYDLETREAAEKKQRNAWGHFERARHALETAIASRLGAGTQ